ncbi:Disease resistance protein (CC-NBS-LRR class) family [Rhynchospora pubera]|uniref:Disease resistance protein (CC-NBS-LRR class) family n=1 Tax=Rhynchospora pubera TaxID=906938 RepID=A0AAV8F968_9POAL|nr:Disease resistance protein (CC-NBS-LRR class) family [Rhynchospora pubera]
MAEITAAAAIEWVVSPVIEMVVNKIGTIIEKKYFEKDTIEDDMKKMNTTLLEIQSTMAIVEKHRIVEPNQVLLVRQIKDSVYDAEDCMSDFDYELTKKKNEKLPPNKIRRAAAFCSRVIHKAIVGYASLKEKLREVNKSLDQAKASAKTLLEHMNAKIPGHMQLPERKNQFLKSSVRSEDIFIGRKTEQESIIQWIHEKKAGPPIIIPIIGQGGLGKTTLAQMIFNDPSLNDHFESKMWLTVSDNFDMLELTKQMLNYLGKNFSLTDATFDYLQRTLKDELASKKILLILDDVWFVKDINGKYSYEENWKQFFAPLRNSNAGSTIIVTTREKLVVNTSKSLGSTRPISLDALNDDDGWSLLKLKAFDGENLALLKFDDANLAANLDDLEPLDKEFVEKLKGLKPIGKKIVEKLKGLPLAIAVVGSRLTGEFDIGEWKRILKDDSLDNGIMEVLHRSYEHLPAHLQRCFAYCSLFPKDYYLKRDRLIYMWIAHGFVLSETGKKLEDVGKSYFSELIARSFIQVIKRNNKEYYVVHDLINDLACHVSQGECYRLKVGSTLENLGSVRHLSVTTKELAHLVSMRDIDKLRTLIILFDYDSEIMGDAAHEAFIKMKRIRVLDIDCCLGKLPDIGECKLLHYLCFRRTRSELAPDTFSKLHLLTVLFIRKMTKGWKSINSWRLELPQSICSMSRLEFVDTSKCIQMELGGQVQHHSVWRGGPATFHVKKKEGWQLSHLRHFNNIKGSLIVYELENVASRKEAVEAQLGTKEQVTKLELYWGETRERNKHNEILEALRPHPNIEWLVIFSYPGDKFPSWLQSNGLSRMTRISINGRSTGFTMLPALGQFSQLEYVCIFLINTVSRIGDEFYGNGIFPSLEKLKIYDMDGLEEWSSPCGVRSFPKLCTLEITYCQNLFSLPEMKSFYSLKSVEISNCPKLRSLPKFPVSLQNLSIRKVHPDLEGQLENKTGLEWDKVAAIPFCQINGVLIEKGKQRGTGGGTYRTLRSVGDDFGLMV